MRWLIRQAASPSVQELAQILNISPILSRLLLLRGMADPEAASRFLNPRLDHLHDPFKMRGMDAAVRRIYQAIERRESILIYGDYDVDGALAVVVLRMALSLAGANVHHHIPHRFRDGYGMRQEVIEQAREQNFSLIISVDTGIRAFPVVERAKELGLDCIITDHHLPLGSSTNAGETATDVIPNAHAVLNPKQANCSYPDKNLCGAGVAFKLAHALLQTHPQHSRRLAPLLCSFLKLVCIGTIADNVPLMGENRVIARLGLEALKTPVNHGLKALIEVAGLGGKSLTADDVGFRLAPRLNAAGRMESAQDVIDLFTAATTAGAQQLALKLNRLNAERQKAEQEILTEIEHRHREQPEAFSGQCLVLEGNGWHRGVIGIVASRVMDRFQRPALVISCQDGAGHGSGRSFENFPLLEALTSCGDLFERFGGHACAAGFVMPAGKIAELRQRVNEFAATRLHRDGLEPELEIDAEVSFAELSPAMIRELEQLGPHGFGNPQPVFAARNAMLSGRPRLLKEKHLKFQAAHDGRALDVIGWRKAAWADRLANPAASLDLAFHLALNDYQNPSTVQLELLDLISR